MNCPKCGNLMYSCKCKYTCEGEEIENMEMTSMEAPLNKDERRYFQTLKRRRDYLDTIIEATDADALSLSYDKAERSALNWAINFIEKRI